MLSSLMPPTILHPGRLRARVALLSLTLAGLTGCQNFATVPLAHVRVIDLAPDAAGLDLYHGNTALAYNLAFGTITSYIQVAPGASVLTVDLAGSHQALSTSEGTFAAGGFYTVFVHRPGATPRALILADRAQPTALRLSSAAAGPSVRLIHEASSLGAVDLYLVPAGQHLAGLAPIATSLAPGTVTNYLAVPACTCTAMVLPAGTPPSSAPAIHAAAQIEFSAAARTLILIDPQLDTPATPQIIATTDAEPPS